MTRSIRALFVLLALLIAIPAHATVSTTASSTVAQANGVTTAFTYQFPMVSAAYAQISITNTTVLPNVITTLTPTQYTITGIGNATGGTVTYPIGGSPLASGYYITISRIVPLVQTTSLCNQGPTFCAIEHGLDYLTYITQQLSTSIQVLTAQLVNQASIAFPVAIGTMQGIVSTVLHPTIPVLTVEQFEAAGSVTPGTTDEATAINNASAAACGGTLIFSNRPYLASGNVIAVNCSEKWSFAPATVWKRVSAAGNFMLQITGASTVFAITGPGTVDINNGTASSSAIDFRANGIASFTGTNVQFINSASAGQWGAAVTLRGFGILADGAFGTVGCQNCSFTEMSEAIASSTTAVGNTLWLDHSSCINMSSICVGPNATGASAGIKTVKSSYNFMQNIGQDSAATGFGVACAGNVTTPSGSCISDHDTIIQADKQCLHAEDGFATVDFSGFNLSKCGNGAGLIDTAAIEIEPSSGTRSIQNVTIHDGTIDGDPAVGTIGGIVFTGAGSVGTVTVHDNEINGNGVALSGPTRNWGLLSGMIMGLANNSFAATGNAIRNVNGDAFVAEVNNIRAVSNRAYDDRTSMLQTQAFCLNFTGANINSISWDGSNDCHNNIDLGVDVVSTVNPIAIQGWQSSVGPISASASSQSTAKPFINLFLGSYGVLTMTFTEPLSGSYASGIYTTTYDGTTFAATKVAIQNETSLALNATPSTNLAMSGTVLQATVLWSAGSGTSDIAATARFDGSILVK